VIQNADSAEDHEHKYDNWYCERQKYGEGDAANSELLQQTGLVRYIA
jgi:hypothetical protein